MSVKSKIIFIAVLFGFQGLLSATTSITTVSPTQSQAIIAVTTDQGVNCTYRASTGTVLVTNLPDITDNGATDARVGSLINGTTHKFILGTRKGSDALGVATAYIVGVTCGGDSEVTKTFSTLPMPFGNMAPDPIPFNSAKFSNADYPTIDWNDQSKGYVDPVTGLKFWRLTSPGQINPGAYVVQYNTTTQKPIDLTGTNKWSSISNASYNAIPSPNNFSNASGGTSDKLFIPLDTSYGGIRGWYPTNNIDDILARVWCGNASQAGITITAQFTLDGGQTLLGTSTTTIACPTTPVIQRAVVPQAAPIPLFKGWGMNPPQHNLISHPSGSVDVQASTVTVHSPTESANYFMVDWATGTTISIGGSYYHIASIISPSTVTISENPGTLSNQAYKGANAGIVIWKSAGGTVDVSIGLDLYISAVPGPATNGDFSMVSPVGVSVSKTADGLTTLSPALTGYLMETDSVSSAANMELWIPFNADGSVRNEVRLLSIGQKVASSGSVNLRGDAAAYPFNVGSSFNFNSVFDGVNGNQFFGLSLGNDSLYRFLRMRYDETLPGCAGYPAYNPWPTSGGYNTSAVAITDDCFQYYNLTPTSSGLDIRSQLVSGYQTGLSTTGASVGPAHASFDLGWMGAPQMGVTGGGLLTASIANSGEHLAVFGSFDSNTGVLKTVRNTWGSDDSEARWGGIHGISYAAGSWRGAGLNTLDTPDASKVFNGPFDMLISSINHAGYGSTASWSSNTTVVSTDVYTCPNTANIPTRYTLAAMQALGYSGADLAGSLNCIQIKVKTPPCNPSPNSSYIFPDTKTEKDEFPCSTPGFGVADAAQSKLMDLKDGDWMLYRPYGPYNENFVILNHSYNGTNNIDLWLLRAARKNYMNPILSNGPDATTSYPNGWAISMAPALKTGSASNFIDISLGASAEWKPDNGTRTNCHGVFGSGTSPGTFSYIEPCDPPYYNGNVNQTIPNMLFKPFLPTATAFPPFAGSSNGLIYGDVQDYPNGTINSGITPYPMMFDYRHLNPGSGSGPEVTNSGLGNVRTLTLVSGTTSTYLIQDGMSAGATDYKRLPLFGYAGHYLLKDISSTTTTNTADLPAYGLCRAFNANECFTGSSAGNIYATVPKAYTTSTFCLTDTFALNAPCAFQLMPYAGQITQFRIDQQNATGSTARKLGYAHGVIGSKYQFSNCRASPEGSFLFCPADWLDGVRSEWLALQIAPLPQTDAIDRTTFVSTPIATVGVPSATKVRARFGMLENNSDLLHCVPYSQCSTEIPTGNATDPYSFTNETVTRQACANGNNCTVNIPALPNRAVYYVIDHLDNSGVIISSEPMNVFVIDGPGPLVSTPGVRGPSDPFPAGFKLFPSTNVWQTDITQAPVSSSSTLWIDTINGHAGHNFHANFGNVALGDGSYNGLPYNLVWSTATPRQGVPLTTYATQSDTPPVGGVPIPPDAIAENDVVGSSLNVSGGDQHLLIVDISSGMIYELFGATRTVPFGTSWTAKQLTVWYSTSNAQRTDGWTSADAGGLPITQGTLRFDEVNPTCNITHAIRMELSLTHGPHIWPARHDADSGGVLNPPFGMRVRMKASVDLSVLSSTTSICIFNALKKYGAILADNGGDWYIDGAPNAGWNDTTLHNDFITVGLPLNTMEVIDESTWIVNPNSQEAKIPSLRSNQWSGKAVLKGGVTAK